MIRNRGLARIAAVLGTLAGAALLAAAVTGCNPEKYVVAKIAPTQGNTVTGEVRFYEEKVGVRIVAKLTGLTPGKHGFHLHEKGDCSAPDAMSAGGHYNPAGASHGGHDADRVHRHLGDLGNIEAGADGKATYDRVDTLLTYAELPGLAVLVHGKEDDLTSQPAGNAGPRVGCGVIAKRE
jgi:Cu-Zn family superoxide dismutase